MSKLNFDASKVAPESRPDPIPAAWYDVQIVESEQKPTASGNGVRLAVVLKVLSGEFVGRQIFDNLNIVNSNPIAQEIALGRLSAYCHAVGVLNITDSSQLHGKPMKVKVAIRPAKDGYDAQNEIKSVKNVNESVGIAGASVTPTQETPAWAKQAPAPAPKQMTEKAAGATYEAFMQNGWTDEMLIEQGYMVAQQQIPAPAVASPTTSAAPPWAKK